ncbi:alpha/beta hydrolase family protein [Leeuwenhoekiella parthenopeia]|uniref:Prolyl oligopeptidase family serine peptidase n=1 Tax=Leeuwenhoekiella parthenopeia TaxID=2890320 RepID=A0ABS8GW33_9FLAO|nr:prolyl oligopeptidase family serine peptidase [Leeuwenhoekiella parthenopeia]MCC4214235.1 prolyl oligopeptidase family serine peptidase [Leeuwenhoekiella parthenopeia]
MKYCRVYIIILLGLSRGIAQETPYLNADDLTKWYKLSNEGLSPDGRWVTYKRHYEKGNDTLVLVNVETERRHEIPNGQGLQFSNNSNWASFKTTEEVNLVNLKNNTIKTFEGYSEASFSTSGSHLLLRNKKELKGQFLHLEKGTPLLLTHLKEVYFNELTEHAVVVLQNDQGTELQVLNLEQDFQIIQKLTTTGTFKAIHWNPNGKSFTVLREEENGNSLLYVNLDTEVFTLNEAQLDGFSFYKGSSSDFGISADNRRVFFKALPLTETGAARDTIQMANVQVWKAKAPWTEIESPNYDWIENGVRLMVWKPQKKQVLPVESKEQPFSLLIPKQRYAITYNSTQYLPKFKTREVIMDLNLLDLETGQSRRIVDSLPFIENSFCGSPEGKYICYFKNKHWWIYDIKTEKHLNLTQGWEIPAYDTTYDRSGIPPPYEVPYFTEGDEAILLYDNWDIWKVNIKTGVRTKLTDGQRRNLQFRLPRSPVRRVSVYEKLNFQTQLAELDSNPLLLVKNLDTYEMGITSLREAQDETFLSYYSLKLYDLQEDQSGRQCIFKQESADHPTRLMYCNLNQKAVKTVEQSNRHEQDYYKARSELITYWQGGHKLLGALHYPVNYDPSKSYPMIVDIYELNSKKLHDYHLPSLTFQRGRIEPVDLNLNGYFVLRPDIRYELNAFGISAVNCVGAAVDKAEEKASINPEAVGLMGVSYGASEAGFILTQTDRYATAIIGNPVTDLVSHYLGYLNFILESAYSRFENHQWRFDKGFYEFPEAYLANSTVHQAAYLNTPLLTWTGIKDPNIEWTQSRELYQALRRLEKEHVLLVYPDEGHGINNTIARKDLYNRHLGWFDHYLKGTPKQDWMD